MEQKYNIELIEEYEDINFYSIHLEGEELSEFENFFEKFPEGCSYDEEIDVVISGWTKSPNEELWNVISVRKATMEMVLELSQ